MKNLEIISGIGLGLRMEHFDDILDSKPSTPWFEVILEDFLNEGPHHTKLLKLRESYPIVFHSIGLNLGGVDKFDSDDLDKRKELYHKFSPLWISDHLCWSSHKSNYHHDLLPIPRTKEALKNLCERINYLQDYFGRSLVLENITSYIDFNKVEYDELTFLKEVLKATGSLLLLDISNVIINYKNRGIDYHPYFDAISMDKVRQIHLSGGSSDEELIIDSHSSEVKNEDIDVLKQIYKKGYKVPAMIERDTNIPTFSKLEEERLKVEGYVNGLL